MPRAPADGVCPPELIACSQLVVQRQEGATAAAWPVTHSAAENTKHELIHYKFEAVVCTRFKFDSIESGIHEVQYAGHECALRKLIFPAKYMIGKSHFA